MKTSLVLLVCACSLGQPTNRSEWQLSPQFAPGQELVYSGVCTEESLVPNVQFQRQYRLENLIFVLETGVQGRKIAIMTSLSELVPGASHTKDSRPAAVRLEVGQLDGQGRLRDPSGGVPLLSLKGPPTLEVGCFVEVPAGRLTKNSQWEINEASRPPRSWKVAGIEAVHGITCVKIVGQQQSLDWDRPRGDQAAWRRRDVLWIAPQGGITHKVERVVELRDPARRNPTQRNTVQYELTSPFRYPGRLFEDRKQEILSAKKFNDEAAALIQQPGPNRPQVDALLQKVSVHLTRNAPTPYRKAVIHLASRLEDVKNGTFIPSPAVEVNPRPQTIAVGQRVPDFVVGELTGKKQSVRLSRLLGRPVLVCYYNPATELGRDVIEFAKNLVQKHGDRIAIMAMAVTNDAELAAKQHRELQLPFAILDGRAMHLTFGVEATPRLVVLDPDGILRIAHTGWGAHVPREIHDEMQRWLKQP